MSTSAAEGTLVVIDPDLPVCSARRVERRLTSLQGMTVSECALS